MTDAELGAAIRELLSAPSGEGASLTLERFPGAGVRVTRERLIVPLDLSQEKLPPKGSPPWWRTVLARRPGNGPIAGTGIRDAVTAVLALARLYR